MDQKKPHNKISPEIEQRLAAIVGGKYLITLDEDKEPYSHDETLQHRFMPAAVVKPGNTSEISAIMKLASTEKIPVTPRGGGHRPGQKARIKLMILLGQELKSKGIKQAFEHIEYSCSN